MMIGHNFVAVDPINLHNHFTSPFIDYYDGEYDEEDQFKFDFNPETDIQWEDIIGPDRELLKVERESEGDTEKQLSKEVPGCRIYAKKCYLCMNNIIENTRDVVIMRCSEICGTRLHFSCVVNSMWPHQKTGIICPVCTMDEHLHIKYGQNPLIQSNRPIESEGGNSLDKREKRDFKSLCSIFSNIMKENKWNFTRREEEENFHNIMEEVKRNINERSKMISGHGVSNNSFVYEDYASFNNHYDEKDANYEQNSILYDTNNEEKRSIYNSRLCEEISSYIIREVTIDALLNMHISIKSIHRYVTDRFEGLLLMGLNIDDLKTMEINHDIDHFVSLYSVCSQKLRSYFGEDQMSLKNLIRIQLSAETMQKLGITVHELCIMKLTQEEMQQFHHIKMEDWIFRLKMTPTCLRVLRIKAKDITHPNGKMKKIGWDMNSFDKYMNLTHQQKNILKLHPVSPRKVNYVPGNKAAVTDTVYNSQYKNKSQKNNQTNTENKQRKDNLEWCRVKRNRSKRNTKYH